MRWLEEKVALLIGGGSGIGRAVVDEFRVEGARVAVLELSGHKCEELDSLGPDVLAIEGDATLLADQKRAVAETVREFGKLDTLATFVGLFDYYKPLQDIPEEALSASFEEMFATNVESCLVAAKASLGELEESNGNIVFTVSTSGFYPGRGGALYVPSKFAVRGLVIQLAHELAPCVRVNGVAPGGTMGTDMRGLKALDLHEQALGDQPDREATLVARTPLQVAMYSKDHAGAYVYLASDRARGLTGVIINSDGGMGVRG